MDLRGFVSYLVSQLLTECQRDGEQHQHLIQPRNRALRLGRLELHGTLIVGELVRGENQRRLLNVETQGEIFGQVWRQTLHVATLHKLIDRLLLRHDQARPTAMQGIQDVRQDVQYLLGRLEGIIGVDIVDVVDCLLEMICCVLDLLQLPWKVLSNARTLYHILLTLNFEAYVL